MGRCWQIFPCKGNIYCQHADEQIWHSFSLLFLVLVYCRPMSTQIIVQTDVVQAIFSRVLMAARAVRHVTSREKDLTVPVLRVFKENIVKSVDMICFY